MAAINYDINVSTSQAQRNIDGLKSALSGLVAAAGISNLYNFANALTDMAKASGISTQALLGFQKAVVANGGDADAAVDSIGKFQQAIEGAAGGSKELQDKFLSLGISMRELGTLSEQDLLGRVVTGLDAIKTNSERSTVAMTFFGKSFRAVDFKGVAADLKTFTDASGSSAAAIDSAGQASQNFQNAAGEIGIQILTALKPISDLAVMITSTTKGIGDFVRTAVEIAVVVGSLTLLGKAFSLVSAGVAALRAAFTTVGSGAASVGKTVTMMGYSISNIFKAFGESIGRVGSAFGMLFKNFGFLKDGLAMIAKGVTVLGASAYAAYQLLVPESLRGKIESFFGATKDGIAEVTKAEDESAKKAQEANAARQEQLRQIQLATKAESDRINKQLQGYKDTLTEANKRYELETRALGLTLEQRTVRDELFQAESRYYTEMSAMAEDYRAKSESASLSDIALLPVIKQKMAELTTAYADQVDQVFLLTDARLKEQAQQQVSLFGIKSRIDLENQLQQLQDQTAKLTLPALEQKYYDIEAAARAAGKAAVEAEEARLNRRLNPEEAKKYYDSALAGVAQLKAATGELSAQSMTFETGFTQAFNSYRDSAYNAASSAQSIFTTATRGMEDVFVNFAKTGKLEFKSLLGTIVEELLRSQIRQLIASQLGGGGVGGGAGGFFGSLFSGIGDLFRANGGPVAAGSSYIVGEKGPELFTAGSAGQITPNSAMGGGGAMSVTYNINAVDAASFNTLVARDPEFLFAVTEQGRRRLPARR